MSKVIEDGLKHFRAKAARYRKLAEKAETEVARLEALLQERQPTPRALDVCPVCEGKGKVANTHGVLQFCIPCDGTGQRR